MTNFAEENFNMFNYNAKDVNINIEKYDRACSNIEKLQNDVLDAVFTIQSLKRSAEDCAKSAFNAKYFWLDYSHTTSILENVQKSGLRSEIVKTFVYMIFNHLLKTEDDYFEDYYCVDINRNQWSEMSYLKAVFSNGFKRFSLMIPISRIDYYNYDTFYNDDFTYNRGFSTFGGGYDNSMKSYYEELVNAIYGKIFNNWLIMIEVSNQTNNDGGHLYNNSEIIAKSIDQNVLIEELRKKLDSIEYNESLITRDSRGTLENSNY